MPETIASAIIAAKKVSLEQGRKKYKTYFKDLAFLFKDYQTKVDAILKLEGHEDCIVTEE